MSHSKSSTSRLHSYFTPSVPVRPASQRLQALHRLEQAVSQIQDGESFRRYLDVQARFHKYSYGNVALILQQRPNATRVAGYNNWLKLHRYVKKGETGIRIIVPMRRKESLDDIEPEKEQNIFFGTGVVFDILQTEGEALATIKVPVLMEEEGTHLYDGLKAIARREGIEVKITNDELGHGSMGTYSPSRREIRIRPAAPLQITKTLAHELAHHFAEDRRSNSESESIAESVAYVVLSHFGLDSGARSFPYVALWSRDKAVLKTVLTTVQKLSARIIDAVEWKRDDNETDLVPNLGSG